MSNGDENLRQDLLTAFDGDDPGTDFDDRVMADIEGGGGEHEISALDGSRRRSRRWILVVAAAAATILVIAWFGSRPDPSAGSPLNASGGEEEGALPRVVEVTVDLPSSVSSGKFTKKLQIFVTKDGKVTFDGKTREWSELSVALRAARKSESDGVLISADRRARWRVIQWVMQACAHPDVQLWNLAFQVRGPDGTAALPVPLPRDRGLGVQAGSPPRITVQLKPAAAERYTRIMLFDQKIDADEQSFTVLAKQLAVLHQVRPEYCPEIHAWGSVPFGDVVRAVDAFRQAGYVDQTFVGAPPPVPTQYSDEPFRSDRTDAPEEELIEEEIIEDHPEIAEQPPIGKPTVNVLIRLRLKDDRPELALGSDAGFEPLDTALPKLTQLIRDLKKKGKTVTGLVESEPDVPYSVLRKVTKTFGKEGVTSIGMK